MSRSLNEREKTNGKTDEKERRLVRAPTQRRGLLMDDAPGNAPRKADSLPTQPETTPPFAVIMAGFLLVFAVLRLFYVPLLDDWSRHYEGGGPYLWARGGILAFHALAALAWLGALRNRRLPWPARARPGGKARATVLGLGTAWAYLLLVSTLRPPTVLLFETCWALAAAPVLIGLLWPRDVFRKLSAAAVSLCLLILGAEGLAHVVAKMAPPNKLPDYGTLHNVKMGEGGNLLPDYDGLVQGESGAVAWKTNSKGFRNSAEFDYEPPENVVRLIWLGDSFVAGYRVDQDETAGARMTATLNAAAVNEYFVITYSPTRKSARPALEAPGRPSRSEIKPPTATRPSRSTPVSIPSPFSI